MLNGASVDVPRSSRMGSPIATDAALPMEAGAYLNADNLPESDDCRFKTSELRSVTTVQTSNLLAQADPAMPDSQGNTLLCLAAQTGDLTQAQQLIHRGADVHHINLDGDNALTLAAAGGHLTFIKWLDSHCPQSVNHENYYGDTALTLAARHGHQPLVQWLVSQDASLTHLNDQLKDALAEAVANGHLKLAQWLSSHTDLRRVYPDGDNLFLHAVRAGHQDMAQWLEDCGVNSQQINESGDNALTLAAHHGYHQLLAWLLGKNAAGIDQINHNGDSLLLIAARQGHCQTVKLLVQNDADTGLVNYAGSSVLTLAAASSESLALWLCNKGTDIHHIESSGDNAFTRAARSGFFQLMQTLEWLGINIHQVNRNNDNAFILLVRQGNLEWCQWLAGKGINIHQVNHQHHNAVTLAALAGSQPLLEWLCGAGVDWQQIPKVQVYDGGRPYVTSLSYSFNAAILAASAGHFTQAQWLMRKGLSIHQRDCYGRNAVIQAVRLGRLEAVRWFSARGIMPEEFPRGFPDCFKSHRLEAMSLAAKLGHLHILQWLHQNGDSLDDHSDERNPLVLAARRGDLPMIQWISRYGAEIDGVDGIGASALSEAISCGHLRLSQWFVAQRPGVIHNIGINQVLVLAAAGGQSAMFRWLSRSERPDNRQANRLLLCALRSGHRSLAVWLCLNVCRSICDNDYTNCNALMLAAERGFLWLTQWLSERTEDINQTTLSGFTAVMLAALRGHLPVVKWLYLEKNANLRQKAGGNADALHLAVIRGHTETAHWLIGQGMVLNPDYFKVHTLLWISDRYNVGLLQYLLRQQLPPRFFHVAMSDAARHADVPALTCCLSAGVSLPTNDDCGESCFSAAAASGSLATLEFLFHHSGGDYDVDKAKQSALLTAARYGNLHIIQWFWQRSGLSRDEKNCCLFAASENTRCHIVKWLYRQGADIKAKNEQGGSGLAALVCDGNVPMLEWFSQQGEDLDQDEKNGQGALSLAIQALEPQVAIWLFHRGFRLVQRDIKCAFTCSRRMVLGMIFKMTSRIRRASLFYSLSLNHKLWLLHALQLNSQNQELIGNDSLGLSEEEANASFARFNQHNDKTLEYKSIVVLANLIGQQSSTLEEGLKIVDDLPIPLVCKDDLRELVIFNLE